MKKLLNLRYCLLTVMTLFAGSLIADPPNPPDPGGPPGGNGGVPVGAPLDENTLILMGLGILFGAYQIYQQYVHREKKEKVQ